MNPTSEGISSDPAAGAVPLEHLEFPEWRQMISEQFVPLEVSTNAQEGIRFSGGMTSTDLQLLHLSEVTTRDVDIYRSPRTIRKADPGLLKVGLQTQGHGIVTQHGRSARLAPGDFAIYDTSEPYRLQFSGPCTTFVLMFHRSALAIGARELEAIAARRIRGDAGVGAVVSPVLTQLRATLLQPSFPGTANFEKAILDLISSTLVEVVDNSSSLRDDLLTRAQNFVKINLSDPELCTDQIAQSCNVSRRTLQKAFESRGLKVAGWMRSYRLDQIRTDLARPSLYSETIQEISTRRGMPNLSHMSRIFKETYGLSPRDYREKSASRPHSEESSSWAGCARKGNGDTTSLAKGGPSNQRVGK